MNQAKIYDELQSLRNELDYYTVVTAITENVLNHRSFSDSAAKAILIYLVTSILGRNNNSNIVLASWALLHGYNVNNLNTERGHLGRRRVKLSEDIAYTGDPNNLDKKENTQYEQIARIYTEKYQTPEQVAAFIDAALNSEFYDREADRAILPGIYIQKQDIPAEEPEHVAEESLAVEPAVKEPNTENTNTDEPAVTESSEDLASEPFVKASRKRYRKKFSLMGIIVLFIFLVVGFYAVIFFGNLSASYTVELKGRYDGNKTWNDELYNARIGDIIQFQVKFVNDRGKLGPIIQSLGDRLGLEITARDVKAQFILPPNLEYIEDSTLFFNSNYQEGILLSSNDIAMTGISIGSYHIDGNAYVRINCRIINTDLQIGENEIPVQVVVTVSDQTQSDEFIVHLVY